MKRIVNKGWLLVYLVDRGGSSRSPEENPADRERVGPSPGIPDPGHHQVGREGKGPANGKPLCVLIAHVHGQRASSHRIAKPGIALARYHFLLAVSDLCVCNFSPRSKP